MDVMKVYPIEVEGEAFEAFRIQFNAMLKKMLSEMQQKNVEAASISAKFDINLMEHEIDDPDTGEPALIKSPEIKHKVTGSMQIKNELTGKFGSVDYQLQWNPEKEKYVMMPVRLAQRSMFDDGYEYDGGEVLPDGEDAAE